jgi:hypothetical protein
VAKITVDRSGFDDGIGGAERDIDALASKIGQKIGVVSTLTSTAINAITGAISAGTSAVTSMISQSVNAYGELEQLVGGVETLFKDSADTIVQYAQNAFQTAGLSQIEYLQTATSFAASLINSLTQVSNTSTQLTEEQVTQQKNALKDQYDNQREAYSNQYSNLQDSLNDQ